MSQLPADDVAAVQRCEQAYNRIRDELSKVIVGQNEVIEQVLVADVRPRPRACWKACRAWPRRCSSARWPSRCT